MVIHWDVDPQIINQFGAISLRYYSIFFVTGLLLGLRLVRGVWIREGWSLAELNRLSLYLFLATIVGARVRHCLFYEPAYFLQSQDTGAFANA